MILKIMYLQTFMQYCEQANSYNNSEEQHGIIIQLVFDISIVEGFKLPPSTSSLFKMSTYLTA